MALKDLDVEMVRIRDHRSRTYYNEALRAYRSGAYRAAISAAWVALVFDILLKYRELSAAGDAEATTFIDGWDRAIAANDVAKLLEHERNLLEHAKTKMGLMNLQEHRLLHRLYEDRHLCAHPAFAVEDKLFEPTDELVRTHIVSIVDIVLSQRPVQGRKIFEAFSTDVQSPGFPSDEGKAIQFVEDKYLSGMRSEVIRNFGIILAKSLIKNVPTEWDNHRIRIVDSLNALRLRRSESWREVLAAVAKLINDDDPEFRPRALAMLADFPEVLPRVEEGPLAALQEVAASDAQLADYPEAFAAVELDPFERVLLTRFADLSRTEVAEVLNVVAAEKFWPNALEWFGRSGGYRDAEANFDIYIRPFTEGMTEQMLDQVLEAIRENGQIWDATGVPGRLFELLKAKQPARPSAGAVDEFYLSLSERLRTRFDDVWKHLLSLGWEQPEQPANED